MHLSVEVFVPAPAADLVHRHDPASLVDLAPTLLSACGIDYDKNEYDGVNLFEDQHEEVYSQYANGTIGTYMVATGKD